MNHANDLFYRVEDFSGLIKDPTPLNRNATYCCVKTNQLMVYRDDEWKCLKITDSQLAAVLNPHHENPYQTMLYKPDWDRVHQLLDNDSRVGHDWRRQVFGYHDVVVDFRWLVEALNLMASQGMEELKHGLQRTQVCSLSTVQ